MLMDMLRQTYRTSQKARRRLKLWISPTITRDRLAADLRALGIAAGDVVFVHASMSNLGKVEDGAETIIEALRDVLTSTGTLIIPTYHMPGRNAYETCLAADEYIFDPKSSPTELGAIPTAFLKFDGVRRSIHPTHSVSALGKQAEYVTEAHHLAPSTLGPDSPWDRLVKLDGKVLGLGISMGPVTFYHMVEDMLPDEFPLPVKTQETFRLKCRDWNGNIVEAPITPGDPQITRMRIDQLKRGDLRAYFWKEFEGVGLLTAGKVGGGRGWHIPARGFYDHLVELMREGITIYSTREQLKRRKPGRQI